MGRFDTKEQIMEVAERTLTMAAPGLSGTQRADVLSSLRARLHYGFTAGRCPTCDRIVAVELVQGFIVDRSEPLWCDGCDGEVVVPPERWVKERFD